MKREVLNNHKVYLARKKLYKSFGYDIDKERAFIIEHAQPIQGRILEAGTGKGHFSLALAKKGYEFTSFDISQQEQGFARLNLAYYGLQKNINFCIEDGENLSFKKESFDVIFSINMLHHLVRPYKVIDEFVRVLSQGGKMVIGDFNESGMLAMDKIHSLEGRRHEGSKVSLSDIKNYLLKWNFKIKEAGTKYQDVLVAEKGVTG